MSPISLKRALEDPPPIDSPKSKAARFNSHTLKKLQTAFNHDPETNLSTQMPSDYSNRLIEMRKISEQSLEKLKAHIPPKPAKEDIRESLKPSDSVEILFPLSDKILQHLNQVRTDAKIVPGGLSQRLYEMMQASVVLWEGPFPRNKMVFKCAPGVVVKAVRRPSDHTEYTALQFLQLAQPSIPAPRPLGLVRMSGITLIFMTHKTSKTLGNVWSRLDCHQKTSIREQLDKILADLRSIPYDLKLPLGGVGGEGCKDVRRHLRKSDKPIKSLIEFEDFLYSNPPMKGPVFTDLLRQLSPPLPSQSSSALPLQIVFTHGDLRPDNIIVEEEIDDKGNHHFNISGLIDWEYSGFYPEYYEAIRCTNCLGPCEKDDWYLFLPSRVSPTRYAQWWLLDRVRETMFL